MSQAFNIVIVGQAGRLAYEAVLFAASLRHAAPDFAGRLFVAEPQPGPLWPDDPRIGDKAALAALDRLNAEILPFESLHFGASYPNGNKVEALAALPDAPFLFFDTDTLVTGPLNTVKFDFDRPSASMARTGTWPVIELYGPDHAETWGTLYDRLELDIAPTLDLSQPDDHWERFLYFNAGWFFHASPREFGERMIKTMRMVRDDPPEALVCQPIYPWLDQIALPPTIHALGGGRPGPDVARLDGELSVHWRVLPLLYAKAPQTTLDLLEDIVRPNWIKKVLKAHPPFHRTIWRGDGQTARALFSERDRRLPEEAIRRRLKRRGLWHR